MSLEFRDGHFEGPMPVEEALKRFQEELPTGHIKAFHLGTQEELQRKHDQASVSQEISKLKERLSALEGAKRIHDEGLIKVPSWKEIEQFKKEAQPDV